MGLKCNSANLWLENAEDPAVKIGRNMRVDTVEFVVSRRHKNVSVDDLPSWGGGQALDSGQLVLYSDEGSLCCGKLSLEGLDGRIFQGLETNSDALLDALLHSLEG